MKIAFVDIQNFRKLQNCRVVFSGEKTVFVGANNSGKTSAMDALILFLKNKYRDFTVRDITLSNWHGIEKIASNWAITDENAMPDLTLTRWHSLFPALDVWLDVADNEVHYVSNLIPTLNWTGGKIGVRLILEPIKPEDLYNAFKTAYNSAIKTKGKRDSLKLWPKSMHDFLEQELQRYFKIKAYILDPSRIDQFIPQTLPDFSEPLEVDPFKGLFKIDIINAQRGFADPNSEANASSDRRLSAQLQRYFEKHLNPTELPDEGDLEALEGIEKAKIDFDKKLKESFSASIGELENLNYPGFSDPEILITTKINPLQGLQHDAAVQFNVHRNGAEPSDGNLFLPEKYNGLGYQNLISMIFSLIRFRDEWMRVGKASKRTVENDDFIEPLHIVLIEEPEAHLHAQVQQVFIKRAYDVLRNHSDLKEETSFTTQLVISTHSSHIAHEIDFVNLRYFKRKPALNANDVPYAEVVNLSTVFGTSDETSKFATRYLKTTHCDLFFADAAILIEGPAERMLIPYFISKNFRELDRCYISLLEIGGSHAHRLKSLIEAIGILTLIITDLDSVEGKSSTKVLPEKGKNYRTGNDTIKSWIPQKTNLDEVLAATTEEKHKGNFVRVAYQYEISLNFTNEDQNVTAIPYTFEDAVVLSNIDFFREKTKSTGLLKKMAEAVKKETILEACRYMFNALSKNSKKAEMALEILYTSEPSELTPPHYIEEGLTWLQEKLTQQNLEYPISNKAEIGSDDNEE